MSKHKIRSILIAIIVIIIAFVIYRIFVNSREPMKKTMGGMQQTRSISVNAVENRDLKVDIPVSGPVSVFRYNEIFAEVGGVLLQGDKPFREGMSFDQDDILIHIDDEEARLNYLAARANFINVLVGIIPDIKINYPDNYEAWSAYLGQLSDSGELPELPEPCCEKEKYFLATRNITNLYYSLKSQETRLAKYLIRAPYDGIITQANIHPGTLVRVGQKLGEFIDPSAFEMETGISQDELQFISVGNPVELHSNDISGTWSGRISRISPRVDAATQTVKVFIAVNGNGLKDGMYLSGQIRSDIITNAVRIPRKLLVNDEYAFIAENGSLIMRRLTPVKFTSENVLVRGFQDGDLLVNELFVDAAEGMKINIIK